MMNKLFISFILFCSVFSVSAQTDNGETREYIGILKLTTHYQVDSNWTEADGKIVGNHFQRLQQLAAEGKVVLAGRMDLPSNDPDMIGIVIIAATTKQEAEKIMFEDPAVMNKIMIATLYPFDVAVQALDN